MDQGLFLSGAAVVTFSGADAALAYVLSRRWTVRLAGAGETVRRLALAETHPRSADHGRPVRSVADSGDSQGPAGQPVGIAWVWLASIAFAGMILSSLVLGVAVLRTNPLGYGGRILGLLVVVLPTTVVLGFVAPEWAHPAYVETTIHLGVALLGATAAATHLQPKAATELANF
jgi:hypothetical protein